MLSCDVLVFNSSVTAQQAQQAQQLFLREKGAAIYILYQLSTINGLIQRKYFFSHFCLLRLLRLLRSAYLPQHLQQKQQKQQKQHLFLRERD